MKTLYEWCIEEFDEFGDIVNSDFYDALKKAPKEELRLCFDKTSSYQLCFVMRKGNEALGEVDRRVVYVNFHNEMPDTFDDGTKIPKRYVKQFNHVNKIYKRPTLLLLQNVAQFEI